MTSTTTRLTVCKSLLLLWMVVVSARADANNTNITSASPSIASTVPSSAAPSILTSTTPSSSNVASANPSSLPPTSASPVTLEPTTLSPTTLEPTTLSPTSLAPSTLSPTTAAPSVIPIVPTSPPTSIPSHRRHSIGKVIARSLGWLILIALSVLCFGAIMSNRYRIYYGLRGLWYTFLRLECTGWVLRKLSRQDGNSNASLNDTIFDQNDLSEGLLLRDSTTL